MSVGIRTARLLPAVLVCLVLGYSINKSINQPLAQTVAMIQEMEKGRLDNRLDMNRSDEIGQMNRMIAGVVSGANAT